MSAAQVPMDLSDPRAGVTGGCKRPVMGFGDQSPVLCESSTLSTAEHFLQTLCLLDKWVVLVIIQQCFFIFGLQDRVSHCTTDCLGTHSVAGLELRDRPPSLPPKCWVCTITAQQVPAVLFITVVIPAFFIDFLKYSCDYEDCVVPHPSIFCDCSFGFNFCSIRCSRLI